jgi:hypothetical protein
MSWRDLLPLPSRERGGERVIARHSPLTPALSPEGRGSKGACALALVLLLTACSGSGGDDVSPSRFGGSNVNTGAYIANATISGPVTGGLRGHALWDSWYDLTELGYVEEEYFVSGTARTYPETQPAPYTTRIIVRRPADPARFNGTVLLDWVNVTAQFENAVDTLEAHAFFHRAGFAYVHVSAQAAGLCCLPGLTPQTWDPLRYAELSHPGDDYSFDIFSQIAKALKFPRSTDAMDGLRVQKILAMGQSQSANRLSAYVRQVQPHARVIDGFLIHSSTGGDADKTFDAPPQAPVLHLLSDWEATPGEPNVTQNYRLWEIAGAAHQDFWVGYHQEVGAGPRTLLSAPQQPASADEDLHAVAGNYGEQYHPLLGACILAGAAFPMRYAVAAAIHHLDRWVKTGALPPAGPRYQFDGSGQLARDADFNALGGIRYPPIEVPVARYRSTDCELGGITIPFTELELQQRYPAHADYVCQLREAALRSMADGFLLRADAEELMARAEAARNRWLDAGTRSCPAGI